MFPTVRVWLSLARISQRSPCPWSEKTKTFPCRSTGTQRGPSGRDKVMTDTATAPANTAVRRFRVEVPEQEIEGLRRRIDATRWPTKELVAGRTQGVQLAVVQELARYWT